MAATVNVIQGGSYQNLMSLSPLYKNDVFNPPARNLFRMNNLIADAVVQQANDLMSHDGSYQTYAGAGGSFIKLGGYRTPTSATWGTFKDDISLFTDASAVAKDIVDIRGNVWLGEQEATTANKFGVDTENHLLYGTNGATPDTVAGVVPTAAPEKYTGLAARFRTPDNAGGAYSPMDPDPATVAQAGVWDAGGTGTATTSIWFIRWGKRACSLITPKGDPQYGLKITDKGLQTQWYSPSGLPTSYRDVYVKEFEWKHGLSIYPGEMGGHHVARLRNIPTSLSTNNAGLKALIYQIIEEYFLNDTEGVMMYLPPRMRTIADILFEAKQNVEFTRENPYQVSPENWSGKVFMRVCRSISIAETYVAAV